MSRPEFFEPNSVSENIRINFEDVKPKIERRKPVLKKHIMSVEQSKSILGKRTIEEAFGTGMNDKERYGQEIPPDFFIYNRGHNAFPSQMDGFITPANSPVNRKNVYETKFNYWREKYNSKQ